MNAGDGSFYDLRLIVPPSVLSSFDVGEETLTEIMKVMLIILFSPH